MKIRIINASEREGGVKLVMLIETLKCKTEYRGGYKNTELMKTFAYDRGSFQSTWNRTHWLKDLHSMSTDAHSKQW